MKVVNALFASPAIQKEVMGALAELDELLNTKDAEAGDSCDLAALLTKVKLSRA